MIQKGLGLVLTMLQRIRGWCSHYMRSMHNTVNFRAPLSIHTSNIPRLCTIRAQNEPSTFEREFEAHKWGG